MHTLTNHDQQLKNLAASLKAANLNQLDMQITLKDKHAAIVYQNEAAIVAKQMSDNAFDEKDTLDALVMNMAEESDAKALASGYSISIEPTLGMHAKIENMITRKCAILDDDNQACGLLCISQLVGTDSWPHRLHAASEIPISAKSCKLLFDGITERESEMLYLLQRGYSLSEIGQLLQLSRCTIVSYFNNLKTRYNVESKPELIKRAIQMGFVFFIPESLLNRP